MDNNISSLLLERALLQSRLEKMIYGSIEIRDKDSKQYIYVHRRIDGLKESKYAGSYSNALYAMIVENNELAKEYKKRLKLVVKELDSLKYIGSELSKEVGINVAIARRNLVDSIYKQAMLEGVATTYADTETIVYGGKVFNMSATDVTKVVNLKRAWEFILCTGVITYPTNYAILCQINAIVEDGFSIMAGKLRTSPVTIGGSTYIPSMPLESLVKEELNELLNSSIGDVDKSVDILLYVMKKQPFLDGNKRTAVIFANHYLISHGKGLIVIPAELVSEYKNLLIDYYEGRNEKIKDFLKSKCYLPL